MDLSDKIHERSKLGGIKPAIERTEGEKIRLAIAFLEKRGYAVMTKLVTSVEIAEITGCSSAHINVLARQDPTFPKGHDVALRMRDKEVNRKYFRYSALEIKAWLESRRGKLDDDN